jgi:DNA-binding SARP family transcriptional activator
VYNLRFLGRLRIFKGERLISRLKLGPKDRSFLIHLSISKARKIALKELYRNFWPQSLKPARNLSHLLVRIKRNLSLPSHLIRIHGDFLRWDFHFTTDYKLFEETLAQATALERAGEWGYAKREYMRAFALFRGEPFRKMYDPWSEHMRRVILNKLETEALHFAKSCLEHGNPPNRVAEPKSVADAKKVLEKVVKIVPQSEEIEKMVREYGGNGVSEKRK